MLKSLNKSGLFSAVSSTAILLALTGSVQAQSPAESYSYNGLTYTYDQTKTSTIETTRDETGKSPERVITYSGQVTAGNIHINGPRHDVEDIYVVAVSYDQLEKVITNPLGQTKTIRYDDNFRPIEVVDVNGVLLRIKYDDFGFISSFTRGADTLLEQVTTFTRNQDGVINSVILPDGRVITKTLNEYDKRYTREV